VEMASRLLGFSLDFAVLSRSNVRSSEIRFNAFKDYGFYEFLLGNTKISGEVT
jgi:hypothetical protein